MSPSTPTPAASPAPEPTSTARVVAALLTVQVAFGTLPVAGKLAMQDVGPYALSLFRVVGASFVFIVLARRERPGPPIPWPDVLRIAGCGLLGMAANQLLFLGGLERTTATNATILTTLIPVITFAVALLLRAERFSARGLAGLALALGGVLVLVEVERLELSSARVVGDLMIVANTICYASFLVLVRPFAGRYGATRVVAISFIASSFAVAPFAAAQLPAAFAQADAAAWAVVAYVVAVPTVLTYWLNTWALRRASASTVAVFIYLQPIVGLALATAVLREPLGGRALLGAAAVLAGVTLVTRRSVKPAAA